MKRQLFILFCAGLVTSSCVQAPVFKGEEYAYITSNYPMVRVNNSEIEPRYSYDLPAGEVTLVVVYRTYLQDYVCTFSWTARAGTAYEVTDQEHKYPLTLYRWEPTNSYWASRQDPVEPVECISKEEK